MGFKSAAQATFVAPCTAYLPRDDGKQFAHAFRVRFKVIKHSDLQELTRERAQVEQQGEVGGEETDAQRDFVGRVLDRVLVDFVDGLTDESDKPLPFTPEYVAAVIDEPQYRSAIFRSFFAHHDKAPGKP